ncbi:FlaD/FlaE family flagellar protein [Halorussus halobius]|uniref:FlaD/FlaE family flagellar protein n=1 Tax=Halorussus halobius TaxID=1710537 RepID=UPI001FCE8CA3|nr:FlaD/FlaE family flagellar protein [Halorussus halobius]
MKLIGFSDQFVWLLGTGLVAMGIMDFMDEEEGEPDDAGSDDDLFGDGMGEDADGMDDDFGGMGMDDGMDEGMGMDDGMGMDGEMDDWADGGDDDFGMGGGTGPTQELENRIDELENEVADISSTVGTVRSENEQISEKVDETEENVRKLLEIYEMVTRGVNPFVDDVQETGGAVGGDAFGEEDGGFGLFEGDEENEEVEEDLDEDVAEAEAESFFDDDFEEEDEFEGEDDFGTDDDFAEEDEFEEEDDFEDDAGEELGFDAPDEAMADDSADDEMAETDADDGEGGQAGGSTFEELKEEYESGDADWAEEDAEASEDDPAAEVDADDSTEEPDDGDFEFEEPADAGPVEETEPVGTVGTDAESAAAPESGLGGKPYLAELPKGYVADLVVMEWLEFLVTEFGPADAVRTIEYYGDIGWISESVEDELLAFASGFAEVESVDADETGPATLEIDDHVRSLTFLSQLTGDAVERKIVEHCAQIRGGSDGLQR